MDPRFEEYERRIRALEELVEARSLRGRVRRIRRARATRWAAFTAALLPTAALAVINLPYVFVNGTVADADAVNANFNAIVSELNQVGQIAETNDSEIVLLATSLFSLDQDVTMLNDDVNTIGSIASNNATSLQALGYTVASNSSGITANSIGIGDNQTAIALNTVAIGSAQIDIAANQTGIAALQTAADETTSAICAKADADGDTYRPYTCDPRCDCFDALSGAAQAGILGCDETSPGTFEIRSNYPGPPLSGTCDEEPLCRGGGCINTGGQLCFDGGDCSSGSCLSGACLPDPCTTNADCSARTSCSNQAATNPSCSFDEDCFNFFPGDTPYTGCSSGCTFGDPPGSCSGYCVSASCGSCSPSTGGICASPSLGCQPACLSDADCGGGRFCVRGVNSEPGDPLGYCALDCTGDTDCDVPSSTILAGMDLVGVGAANSPAVVQCTATENGATVFASDLNSNDALDCIADAEAVLGQACDPAP